MARLGRRPLLLYGALAVAATAAIVFGLNSVYSFFGGSSASAGTQRTATVASGTVQSSVSASGNVGVATSASADFSTSGTLTAVAVAVGDRVKAGQVLARIDPTSAQNTLRQAEANLEQARSTLASAEAGQTTAQRLSNESSVQQSQNQLTSAKQSLATDKQNLADAKKQLAADIALDCPPASTGSSGANASASASGNSGSGSTGSSGTGSNSTGSSGTGSNSTGSNSTGSNSTGSASATTGSTATGSTGTGSSNATSSSAGSGSTASSSGAATGSGSSGHSGTGSSGTGSSGSGAASAGQGTSVGTTAAESTSSAQVLAAVDTPTTTNAQQTSPPTVSTGAASSITATGATLTGTVNPQGFDTYYHFEYGTTTGVEEQTPPLDAGSGTSQVQISVPLTGLQPSTTYYFRFVASNQNGAQKGTELTVTTAAAIAPVATTGSASGVATSSATLSGAVDPESNDTTYQFVYGTTKAFGSSTPSVDAGSGAAATQVSALLTGLKPGTTYVYELVATSPFGTTRGVVQFFTTGTASSASTAAASNVTTSSATLNGTVDPQGANTSYSFEYGTGRKLDHRTATKSAGASNGSVSVSADVAGLEPGKTYRFRVRATNVVGASVGPVETFTTPVAAKASVTAGSASGVGMATATLSGTIDPNASDTSYRFEYGRTEAYGSTTAKVDLGSGSSATQVSAVVSGLDPGVTYVFRLVATNAYGTSSGAEETFTTAGAPGKPAATTASASSVLATSATLTGTVDANGTDTTYRFEFGTTASADAKTATADAGSAQGAVEVTATVKGLKADTTYLFRLVATNRYGTSIGTEQVVTTAQRSCTTDTSTVTTDEQAVQQAEASVSSAKLGLQQTRASIAESSTPDSATIAQDQAAVAEDEATVATDRSALDETTLRAPVAGTVTAVDGSVGETVSGSGSSVSSAAASASSAASAAGSGTGAGSGNGSSASSSSGLFTIDSLDKLEVVSGFAEADATKLAVGQPATITFPALPNTEVAGKVTAVSSTSTVVSNVVTYDATITLVNPPVEVKEGMTANVSVVTETRANVLELPSSAITTNGNASTVELLQNGKTTVTPVTIGLVGASTTEIVRGLAKGDVVVEPTVNVTAATASTGTGTGGLGGGGGIFGGGGGGGGAGAIFRNAGG